MERVVVKIGDEQFVPEPIEYNPWEDIYEYYMNRKGRFYFRSRYNKIVISCADIPEELRNLKYGMELKVFLH